MAVPTATSLAHIYPEASLPVQKSRWQALLARFEQTYGRSAEFVSRSPGRVNIIGEVGKSTTTAPDRNADGTMFAAH